jgi:hypothetical protein
MSTFQRIACPLFVALPFARRDSRGETGQGRVSPILALPFAGSDTFFHCELLLRAFLVLACTQQHTHQKNAIPKGTHEPRVHLVAIIELH